DGLHTAVRDLLAGIAVTEDVRSAQRVAGAVPGLRVVTRDGDAVGRGWAVGGSESGTSTLEVQAAVDRASQDAAAASQRAEELEGALADAQSEEDVCRERAEATFAALGESDAAMMSVYEQLGRLGEQVRSAESDAARLARQRDEAETSRAQAAERLAELDERVREAERDAPDDEDGDGDGELAEARQEAAAAVDEARSVEVEARLALRTAEERVEAVRGRADGLRRTAVAERDKRARAERARRRRLQAAEVAS